MINTFLRKCIYKCFLLFISIIFSLSLFSQPVITSFSPASGTVGSTVTILGNNFNPIPANNVVFFGAVRAVVTASATSYMTVTVPVGATYEPINVTTGGLTGYSLLPFVVTSPGGGGAAFQPGSLSSPLNVSTGSGPTTVFASDVDGDGKPDMVSVNAYSNTLSVYRNTSISGTLAFSPRVNFAVGSLPQMVFMGDIDGDGKPDALVPNYNSGTVSVFINISTPGTISFAAKADFTVGAGPLDARIGDVDGDGKPDIVVTNNSANTVSVLRNTTTNGTMSFAAKIDLTTGGNPQNAILSDLDGDRKPEIAVIDGYANVSIYQNTSTGSAISFAAKINIACGSSPNYMAVGDLDNNGKPELAVACNRSVTVLQNSSSAGSLTFARSDHSTGLDNYFVSMGDIDGDGKPDLAVNSFSTKKVALLRNSSNTANINFEPEINYITVSNPFGNGLCDFEGDGLIDLAVVNFGDNSISVRRNLTYDPNTLGITTFSPTSAGTGTEITITGTNLIGTSSVSFGGVAAATFTIVSATTVKAIVGSGASGNVQIVTGNGNASLGGFVYVPVPIINSFTPVVAGTGFKITISGSNFESVSGVRFGGINAASFSLLSPGEIEAYVGNGASGNVEIITVGGTATANGFTYIPPPVVNSFTPANGVPGSTITISGNNFDSTSAVYFGEVQAASFSIISSTSIQAVVQGACGGAIKVINPYGTGTKAGFYNGISINSFNPHQGPVDTTVIINGVGFSNNKDENIVFFGAVRGQVLEAANLQLKVKVPAGATYSPISVTTSNATAFTTIPFNVTFHASDTLKAGALSKKTDIFSATYPSPYYTNPFDVAFGDLDGDGKAEVVVSNFYINSVSVYKNGSVPGLIILFPQTELYTQGQPTKVNILDLNGDGKPEIVVHYYSSSFNIYKNLSSPGNLNFSIMDKDTLGGFSYERVVVADFDSDGKPDLAAALGTSNKVSVVRNTSNPSEISFDNPVYFMAEQEPRSVVAADFDGDGKMDMAVSNFNNNTISIFKNVSSPGEILFNTPINISADNELGTLIAADFDNDGKADLAVISRVHNNVSVFKNVTLSGGIAFSTPLNYATGDYPYNLVTSDINGDGKTDLLLINLFSGSLSLFQNNSIGGVINFLPKVDFETASQPIAVSSCDIDGDGKADVAVANFPYNSISIFRNQVGEIPKLQLCPNGNGTLTTNINGTVYQWQINTGSGFTNIGNNSNYSGTGTPTLTLSNMPSGFYGYQYRCMVDGVNDEATALQFVNTWTGANNNLWANSANWSCGSVPDDNTDVIIKSGTVLVNSNSICRSLVLTPGVNFSVSPGVTFTVTH